MHDKVRRDAMANCQRQSPLLHQHQPLLSTQQNKHTQTEAHDNPRQNAVRCPPSGKCRPPWNVSDEAVDVGWTQERRWATRWSHRSDLVNTGSDDHSEQTAKTLADVTLDDGTWLKHRNKHIILVKYTRVTWWVRQRPTNLSRHISVSCLGNVERGSERAQNWHRDGSSEMAFSTARLRLHRVRLISHRHPGHVAVSSFRRASASRCDRQLEHIRCPFVHCKARTRPHNLPMQLTAVQQLYSCNKLQNKLPFSKQQLFNVTTLYSRTWPLKVAHSASHVIYLYFCRVLL